MDEHLHPNATKAGMMDAPASHSDTGVNERRWGVWAVVGAALAAVIGVSVVTAANQSSDSKGDSAKPFSLEPYKENGSGNASSTSELSRVVLTEPAVTRLGLETAPVRTVSTGGKARPVVPFSAVVYDPKGVAWVYTATAPRSYLRQRLTIDRVAGGLAVFSSGPSVGTEVVATGAAELFGAEIEFGKG
jgi:hypothetical protein